MMGHLIKIEYGVYIDAEIISSVCVIGDVLEIKDAEREILYSKTYKTRTAAFYRCRVIMRIVNKFRR